MCSQPAAAASHIRYTRFSSPCALGWRAGERGPIGRRRPCGGREQRKDGLGMRWDGGRAGVVWAVASASDRDGCGPVVLRGDRPVAGVDGWDGWIEPLTLQASKTNCWRRRQGRRRAGLAWGRHWKEKKERLLLYWGWWVDESLWVAVQEVCDWLLRGQKTLHEE